MYFLKKNGLQKFPFVDSLNEIQGVFLILLMFFLKKKKAFRENPDSLQKLDELYRERLFSLS